MQEVIPSPRWWPLIIKRCTCVVARHCDIPHSERPRTDEKYGCAVIVVVIVVAIMAEISLPTARR